MIFSFDWHCLRSRSGVEINSNALRSLWFFLVMGILLGLYGSSIQAWEIPAKVVKQVDTPWKMNDWNTENQPYQFVPRENFSLKDAPGSKLEFLDQRRPDSFSGYRFRELSEPKKSFAETNLHFRPDKRLESRSVSPHHNQPVLLDHNGQLFIFRPWK